MGLLLSGETSPARRSQTKLRDPSNLIVSRFHLFAQFSSSLL
jgi:hypothetical protein